MYHAAVKEGTNMCIFEKFILTTFLFLQLMLFSDQVYVDLDLIFQNNF